MVRQVVSLFLIFVISSACTATASAHQAAPAAPVVVSTAPAALASPVIPTATPGVANIALPSQSTASPAPQNTAALGELNFPIRAAFYYPWFPEAWKQQGMDPFTHYTPGLGFYSQDDLSVIRQHITEMQYGKIQAGIASWWGQGTPTDKRFPNLLKLGEQMGFYWSVYAESEGTGNPSVDAIRSDLVYIRDKFSQSPAYLKIAGRFVVFVYGEPSDGCEMVDRWTQANTVGAYLVLKIFPGYLKCSSQPDSWHQYAPAAATYQTHQFSYTISPGFWKGTEPQARLDRDTARWAQDIQTMLASKANFQLITTFNEWGEGTAVENAKEWSSSSGFGLYLDALHYDGNLPASFLQPNGPLVVELRR
jgi:hypothetical protein